MFSLFHISHVTAFRSRVCLILIASIKFYCTIVSVSSTLVVSEGRTVVCGGFVESGECTSDDSVLYSVLFGSPDSGPPWLTGVIESELGRNLGAGRPCRLWPLTATAALRLVAAAVTGCTVPGGIADGTGIPPGGGGSCMKRYCRYCSNDGTSEDASDGFGAVTAPKGDRPDGKRGVGANGRPRG